MTIKGNKAAMFCSDPMSGSHFIVQTSKFLLIDATAVTLGEGHGKVIQYITPDQLEIVDQWCTRIPPPHRRGYQAAMGELQLNVFQNHKAAVLKAT